MGMVRLGKAERISEEYRKIKVGTHFYRKRAWMLAGALSYLVIAFAGFFIGARLAAHNLNSLHRNLAAPEFGGLLNKMAILQSGDTQGGTRLFDQGIDNYILTFKQNMKMNAEVANDPRVLQVMMMAKVYRSAYPSREESISSEVQTALADIPPIKGNEALLSAGQKSLLNLIHRQKEPADVE